jgi:hypothetical protein
MGYHREFSYGLWAAVGNLVIVLDLVSQVRDVVLMNVYLDLGSCYCPFKSKKTHN